MSQQKPESIASDLMVRHFEGLVIDMHLIMNYSIYLVARTTIGQMMHYSDSIMMRYVEQYWLGSTSGHLTLLMMRLPIIHKLAYQAVDHLQQEIMLLCGDFYAENTN